MKLINLFGGMYHDQTKNAKKSAFGFAGCADVVWRMDGCRFRFYPDCVSGD